ncbi:UDP-N-acetylmuramoylalanine--D-glutamate ligase [Candidatus Pelagibacter ubique HTCC1002]|uniref:UDP-N-acetylmuramoylalanine--D-glutamate ligase n=1 Tax=Pelagibacter ubique (strain HTCC1002) TaxID=314261 RepID=Q1V0D3_PELU1|nr:UDP-N-acetylmuramoyl-L-alanine--D-glutamate ligase [Candidatus Pelagibacter ubique]EAS85295.1 UDP-N-acetylmuramoylalanine--D-glutamate ligase [Candidatus Pelagibacter ubique HTCC1002]
MLNLEKNFLKKRILIYGLGKSGLSTYSYLKKNNIISLYDDRIITKKNIKDTYTTYKEIIKKKFDCIIISPGIDINNCKLSRFLKKNHKKIYTDLDIFYSRYAFNQKITITGTNGKSTTAKLLYDILKDQKKDVRLVGNIGNPVLLEKKIKKDTLFVIEASSYQLEYSKLFKTNISLILNISPDHLERHKTINKYVSAKFKLIKNQSKNDIAILNTKNFYIKRKLKQKKFAPSILKIEKYVSDRFIKKIDNHYFDTDGNKENLTFVLKVSKILKLKNNLLLKSLKNFKGLSFRQEIIHNSKFLKIINDSKATSFSSSERLLKSLKNIYWIIGGLPKKGDKFLLKKNDCKKIKLYIFGKNQKFFINELKNKMAFKSFLNLKSLIAKVFLDIKNENNFIKKTILFSPASASFDTFKNFEERGRYFNKLIKNYIK